MFISGQGTPTNTHEHCSQHALSMHIHNSNIRICIILQLFTNLPECTTLYEVCQNIFNRAKPADNHTRRLHKHICIHLGIEEDSQTSLADLPHLLLGHYSSDTLITLPFTCAFSLAPFQLDEPKTTLPLLPAPPEYVAYDTPLPQSSQANLPPLNLSIERPPRPPSRPVENHLSDGLLQLANRVDNTHHTVTLTYQHPAPATTSTTQGENPGTSYPSTAEFHTQGGSRLEQRYTYTSSDSDNGQSSQKYARNSLAPTELTGSFMSNTVEAKKVAKIAPLIHARLSSCQENSNNTFTELTSAQVDHMLRSSSEDTNSPIHFNAPPPDIRIETQVQNKLLKRRRKTNSSAKLLKKVKVTVAPVFPSYNAEIAMQEVYTKIGPLYEADALDIHTLLNTLDNTPGIFANEIFQRSISGNVSEAELDYFQKHRAHILYLRLKEKLLDRLSNTSIVEYNNSLEELEEFSPDLSGTPTCNDCRTPHEPRKMCLDRLAGGPSILTCQNTPISYNQLVGHDLIMYGLSPSFRSVEPNLLDHVLNMSPLTLKFASGPLTRSLRDMDREYFVPQTNTLYHDIVALIGRLDQNRTLPILVEFRPRLGLVVTGERLPVECDNFIRTLALIQKHYTGLIIGLSPTPHWIVGMDVNSYQAVKTLAHKAACYLTGFGLAAGIYVITCEIASLPTGDHPRHYTMRKRFKRSFIFDRQGRFSREGRRRLCHDLEAEMRRIVNLNMANLLRDFPITN